MISITTYNNTANYSKTKKTITNRQINYFQKLNISFGAKADLSLKNVYLNKLKGIKLPVRVKSLIEALIAKGEDGKLHELQAKVYKGLLKCKTLADVKKSFPEFSDVIEAPVLIAVREDKSIPERHKSHFNPNSKTKKSLIYDIKDGNISGTLKNGQKETLDIKTLSVKLLQLIYAENYTYAELGKIFGRDHKAWSRLAKYLHIPALENKYIKYKQFSDTESNAISTKKRMDTMSKKSPQELQDIIKRRSQSLANLSIEKKAEIQAKKMKTRRAHPKEWQQNLCAMYKRRSDKAYEILGEDIKTIKKRFFQNYETPKNRIILSRVFEKLANGKEINELEKRMVSKYRRDFNRTYPEIKSFLGKALSLSAKLDKAKTYIERKAVEEEIKILKAKIKDYSTKILDTTR